MAGRPVAEADFYDREAELFEIGWRDAKPDEWETLGRELINALRELEGRWLIMVDELPVFVLNWLIDVLIGDGYLVEAEGRYRFRSSLLREFWHRRFAQ
jgi:hypothetical protein